MELAPHMNFRLTYNALFKICYHMENYIPFSPKSVFFGQNDKNGIQIWKKGLCYPNINVLRLISGEKK